MTDSLTNKELTSATKHAVEQGGQARKSDSSHLSASEWRRIIKGFNEVDSPYPNARLIHHVFEERVQLRPHAIAVSCKKEHLTYRNLSVRSNQLARYLMNHRAHHGSPVAICMERSVEMIVGLLGILKAGGAYVPLEPSYPHARLRYMLDDCRPALVLTQEHLRRTLPTTPNTPTIAIDTQWPDIATHAGDVISDPTALTPESLAYVIYTSGSTGIPKGVMVEHRNVTRFLAAVDSLFDVDERFTWSLFHSFAFDVSVREMWGALLSGGKLIVVPYGTSRFPRDLYALISSEKVSILHQTPSAFRRLVAAQGDSDASHCLEMVVLGGEALQVRSLRPWYERKGNEQTMIANMYGPTETTVFVTCQRVRDIDKDPHGGSVIGIPTPHSNVYILNEDREPVPLGVTGEIYIGGTGVARGYLNRPDLTAERFVVDPFSDVLDARMYRSGDLGRWRADGTVECRGRNDSQVKVRGYRIELGEIESHLASLEGVREAVVLLRHDVSDEAQLVAYLTVAESAQLPPTTIRANLLRRLPVHMVPTEYLLLEQMPLNASGKIDRKALQNLGRSDEQRVAAEILEQGERTG